MVGSTYADIPDVSARFAFIQQFKCKVVFSKEAENQQKLSESEEELKLLSLFVEPSK